MNTLIQVEILQVTKSIIASLNNESIILQITRNIHKIANLQNTVTHNN